MFRLKMFIDSLLGMHESKSGHAPDGLVDMSAIVNPLLNITKNGRPLRSPDRFGIGDFVGRLADGLVRNDFSSKNLQRVIATLLVLIALMLRRITKHDPSLMPEEFLLDVADQDDIRGLQSAFGAQPYWLSAEGEMIVDFRGDPLFARPVPVTAAAILGFTTRKLRRPFEEWLKEREETVESQSDDTPLDYEFIDENEVEGDVDPLDDFDDLTDPYDPTEDCDPTEDEED